MRRWWTLAVVLLAGCAGGPDADDGDTDDTLVSGEVTWHGAVRPIAERHCTSCHKRGGLGPFSMVHVDDMFAEGPPPWAPSTVGVVEAGTMPPWPASTACHPIDHARVLTDAEVATFRAWFDEGMPEGDPATYEAPEPAEDPVQGLGAPGWTLRAERAYAPPRGRPDDYHCLPLGEPVAEDTYLRAIQVEPDQDAFVHHAIVYMVEPAAVPEVVELDGEDAVVGYPCFGGPLASEAGIEGQAFSNLHTWVPGQRPEVLPEGDARFVPQGAQLVLQVHYNLLSIPQGEQAPADHTAVHMWTLPRGQVPLGLIATIPLANYDIVIPPDEPESTHVKTFDLGLTALVVGMTPHMHQLGERIAVEVQRDGGGTDCVVDVPRWDFDWQQDYRFPITEPFVLAPGDVVSLTCTYDNSAVNQPVVNGEQLDPTTVRWGEGTLDEMCLAYAHVRYPAAGGGCGPFQACFAVCPEGDGACLGSCLVGAANECGGCALGGLGACAARACGVSFVPLAACLDGCDDGLGSCLLGDCRGEAEAYLGCLHPHVLDGTCNPDLATCGVAF